MTRTEPTPSDNYLNETTYYEESLLLILKGKYREGIDRLRDEMFAYDNDIGLLLYAYMQENGIAVNKNYDNAIYYYSTAYDHNFGLDGIEIAPVKNPTIKSLNAKYDNAIALLRDFADNLFIKSERGLSLHIKYNDDALLENIKKTYITVEELHKEHRVIRDTLSDDAKEKWLYRCLINIDVPFNAIKSRIMGGYFLRSKKRAVPLMPPDKRFVELLHNCISLLGDDEDRLEKGRKGIVGIAEQSGDEKWNYKAGLWYEFGEFGRDIVEAGRYYALAGEYCDKDLERLKSKEEYQLLSDPKAGSGERCLELAKQYQYKGPIMATQLALKAIAQGSEASPHLTKLIHFDGSTIRYGVEPLIEPRYLRAERLKKENDKAVQQYLSDAASKLKEREEALKKEEAEKRKREAERRAKEEAERRAREEAERKAKAPKITITLHNVHGTNNNLNIEYRIEGKNLYHKLDPFDSDFAFIKSHEVIDYDNKIRAKNKWHIKGEIIECWSKDGKKKFDTPKEAYIETELNIHDPSPVNTIKGGSIEACFIPIYERGEFVLVLETTVQNPLLSNGYNVLRRHSILIRLEPHIIRTTKLQVLDWDNRNRRDYVTHNN